MPDNSEKRVAIYVPEEIHHAGRKRAADEGTNFQQVLYPLFESWALRKEKITAPIASTPGEGKFAKLHAMLDTVLNSENDLQRKILTQQLEACYSQVEATASTAASKKKA